MAEIPTYQPQEAAAPLPTPFNNARVSPAAEGAPIGEGLQQLGSGLAEIQLKAKQRADTVAIEDAYSKAQGALNSIVLDPKTGYTGLNGADAAPPPGAPDEVKKNPPAQQAIQKLNAALDQIQGGLANPDQQREIGWRLARLREAGTRAVLTHEVQQQKVVGAAIHAGAQDQAVLTASTAAANLASKPEDLQKPMLDIVENARLRAVGEFGSGATDEMVKSVALPDLQRAAVAAMSAGLNAPGATPARAQQLFGVYGQFLGEHRGTIEKAMANLASTSLAEQQGSSLLAQAVDRTTGWIDANKAQDLLAKVPESPQKGDVSEYVIKRLRQSDALRDQQTTANLNLARQQASQTDGSYDLTAIKPATKAWLQRNATRQWDDLQEWIKRNNASDQKAEDRAALPQERANFTRAQWEMATQPEKFATMTPDEFDAKYTTSLAPKDYRTLGGLWREQLTSAGKEPARLPPVVLDTALSVGRAAGIFPGGNQPPTKWGNNDAKAAWESLTATLIKEADQFRRTNGVPPKAEDLNKMAVNHLVGVRLPGAGLFGSDKTTTALEAEQANGGALPANAEVVSVPGVPAADVERIKGRLAKNGLAASGASILTVYQREQKRKAKGQ